MGFKKIKRIMAREGLIIIGIIALSCCIFFISSIYPPMPKPVRIEQIDKSKPIDLFEEKRVRSGKTDKIYHLSDIELMYKKRQKIKDFSLKFPILAYPVYLLIRFIIWAIKTLGEK